MRKNNTNCKKIHKLSSVFPGIILHKSLYTEQGTRQNMNVPHKNLSAAIRIGLKGAITHVSVVKTHKIDGLVAHVKPAKRI